MVTLAARWPIFAFYEKIFSTTLHYTRSTVFDPIRAIIAICLTPLFGPEWLLSTKIRHEEFMYSRVVVLL